MDKHLVISQIQSKWKCSIIDLDTLEGKLKYKTCTIYHLFFDDIIVYVGQSVDIKSRLQSHRADGKKFDSVAYFTCPYEDRDKIEMEQIRLYKPILNSSGISGGDKVDAIDTQKYIICKDYRVIKKSDCIEKDGIFLFWETKVDSRSSRLYLTKNWHYYPETRKIVLAGTLKTTPPHYGGYSLEDTYLENQHLVQAVIKQTVEQKKGLGKLVFKCGKYKGRQFRLCTDESYKKWYAETVLGIEYK